MQTTYYHVACQFSPNTWYTQIRYHFHKPLRFSLNQLVSRSLGLNIKENLLLQSRKTTDFILPLCIITTLPFTSRELLV